MDGIVKTPFGCWKATWEGRRLISLRPCRRDSGPSAPRWITHPLNLYFNGRHPSFDYVVIDYHSYSPFQEKVLREVRRIPYGAVRSYGAIARVVGRPRAARAVGAAVGANRTPLVIPCHRVVRSNGELGGFGLGLRLKKRLLELEK